MANQHLTPEAFAALQSELERSRMHFQALLTKTTELSSAIGILGLAIEREPETAVDLARILSEYTCDLVEAARQRFA